MFPQWSDYYPDQKTYMESLKLRLSRLKRKAGVVTVTQESTPSKAEMSAAWSLQEGKSIQVPPYSKTQWLNPSTGVLENLYVNLPEYSLLPFGIQAEELTLPNTEIIGRYLMQQGDAAAATYTASWTKTYRAIWFYWSVRSTLAATASTFLIQPNALITSIYSHSALRLDQTPQIISDTAYNASSGWNIANIPAANASNAALFGQGQGVLYFPDATTQAKSGFFEALHLTNDGSGATELRYNNGGWHINTTQAISSLRFVPQGNFAVGSKIVVMGLHPQN